MSFTCLQRCGACAGRGYDRAISGLSEPVAGSANGVHDARRRDIAHYHTYLRNRFMHVEILCDLARAFNLTARLPRSMCLPAQRRSCVDATDLRASVSLVIAALPLRRMLSVDDLDLAALTV